MVFCLLLVCSVIAQQPQQISSAPASTAGQTPIKQGYLGASVQTLTHEKAQERKLTNQKGVLVVEVSSKSPAEIAGLKEGDIIIECDGKEVTNHPSLVSIIRQIHPETKVVVKFIRDGEVETTTVVLSERPPALVCIERGSTKLAKNDFSGATADFTEAIHFDPKSALAHLNRGVAKANSGDPNGAISDYTEAIRLDPKNVLAYLNRGQAKADSGGHAEAIVDYTEAIRLDRFNSSSFYLRGYSKSLQSDFTGAITDYTEAIHLDPDNFMIYNNRAFARDQLGDKSRAVEDRAISAKIEEQVTFVAFCQKAKAWRELPVKPTLSEQVQQYRTLAEEAYQHQDYQASVSYYEKGLAVDLMWAQGHFNAASLFGDYLQNYDKAVSHMRRYLELRPDAPNAAAGRQQMDLWKNKISPGSGAALNSSINQPTIPTNTGGSGRGLLGVVIADVTQELAGHFGLLEAKGALVTQVTENSAADHAGIKVGDQILRYNGHDVTNTHDLRNAVATTAPGAKVAIELLRAGKTETMTATLGKLAESNVAPPTRPPEEPASVGGLHLK